MAWKWNPFRRREKAEAPAPEPTPAAPAPGPQAPTQAPKKRGLLGRLFGRKEKPAAPAPAPAAPPAGGPPTPPAPPAPPSGPAEEPEEYEKGEEGEEEEEEERKYPPFLHVSADGVWKISDTEWDGIMSGTLHGQDVKTFIDAMEGRGGPNYYVAIPLIAEAYGIDGDLIDVGASVIRSVTY
jgi:hypothetical protein